MKEQPKSRELLPCPFCGEPGEWINTTLDDSHWYIRCSNGECHVNIKADRRDKAIGFWNRRVSGEPPKPENVDEQEEIWRESEESWQGDESLLSYHEWMARNFIIQRRVEKLSGEAKTPDAKKFWMDYFGATELEADCNRMTIACMEKFRRLTGGSVPTPSDEDDDEIRETYRLPRT